MECNVADVSATVPAANACLKSLFTKSSEGLPHLSFVDMFGQLLQQYDTLKSATKFFVKQTIRDSTLWAQRHHLTIRQNGSLKQEISKLRQENTNRKVETDQVIANLQERVTAMQQKLEEKDRQLSQFRKIHEGMTPESPRHPLRIPPSASGSGGGGGGARRVSGDLQPPLKGFLLQKEAQERAKQQALAQSQGHRPMILGGNPYNRQGRPSSTEHSFMTPPTQAVEGIDTGRIRSLNSYTGFAFSSQPATQHINKRRRGQPGNIDSHQGAMSPSHAFSHGQSGGQTAARGPATYFQQTGHRR
jgi:hypothetical protein